eukprot:7250128-Alexandrium_andersonii.AAC.1
MPVRPLDFATYNLDEVDMVDDFVMPLEGEAGEAGADRPGGSATVDGPNPMSAEEGRALRVPRDPAQPSDEERRRQECTRLPFRSRRAHC